MPLRDHFRPPVLQMASWEGLHAMWPAYMVGQLRKSLPPGFTAEPRVHLGTLVELDAGAFEAEESPSPAPSGSGTATAWAPARPSLDVGTTIPDEYEYEVRIHDMTRGRVLVAAIEIVSPANKDRPENRDAFVAKCASLFQKGVAVSIIDLVTPRHFNLYGEMLARIGHADPALGDPPPPVYAASCRWVKKGKRTRLQTWYQTLAVGEPLPTLPLWLTEDLAVPLRLEDSYEQACNDLWIT